MPALGATRPSAARWLLQAFSVCHCHIIFLVGLGKRRCACCVSDPKENCDLYPAGPVLPEELGRERDGTEAAVGAVDLLGARLGISPGGCKITAPALGTARQWQATNLPAGSEAEGKRTAACPLESQRRRRRRPAGAISDIGRNVLASCTLLVLLRRKHKCLATPAA